MKTKHFTRRHHGLNTLILTVVLMIIVIGCESNQNHHSSEPAGLVDSLGEQISGLTESLDTQTKEIRSSATQRAKDLFKIEYQLLTFPNETNSTEIQGELASLGTERWNCFHVDRTSEQITVYCKRLPWDYLRLATTIF